MEFKTTLEIVTKDIQDIEKLVSNFKNYSSIPNIELDLALSRLRNVYDLLLMFKDDKRAESLLQVTIPKADTPEPKAIPVIEDEPILVVKISEEPKTATPIEEITIKTEIKAEILPDVVPEFESPKEVKTQIPSTAKEEKTFLNEKHAVSVGKKDVASKLQSQGIKSIAGSLGINDKFLFIRELFGGNAEIFRQTMEQLDESRNFNDAYTILITNFQWDMDSEVVQMLLNLIRRKFISSGNE